MGIPLFRIPVLLAALSLIYGIYASPTYGEEFSPEIQEEMSVEKMMELMKKEGYSVTLDDDGDILWKIEGYNTWILLEDDGSTILFYTGFVDTNTTLRDVNDWNQNKKYSRSYIDDDGDPNLEADLDLNGGVTMGRIVTYLKTCHISFQTWLSEVVR